MKKQRLSVAYRTRDLRDITKTSNKMLWLFVVVMFAAIFAGAALK